VDRQAQAPYDVASRGAAKEDMMRALEEQIAHLTRTVEELSDVVAGQQDEITRLSTRVRMLMEREAGREQAGGGAHVFGDERPPHY
jgi:SlyX protein